MSLFWEWITKLALHTETLVSRRKGGTTAVQELALASEMLG